jgi:flagellar L-ring protein precursor FlgH
MALLCLLLCTAAAADSLYTPESGFRSLFSDRKALRVGDILHILITETASANQTITNSTASNTDASLGPGVGVLSFLPLLGYQGGLQAQSRGNATRSESFVARVAVTVTGLSPTGNLLIEGCREVGVNHDRQVIKLCGEVRPRDISADNTIPSYRVANATIAYTGSDPLKPGRKVGIITRLLHWVF